MRFGEEMIYYGAMMNANENNFAFVKRNFYFESILGSFDGVEGETLSFSDVFHRNFSDFLLKNQKANYFNELKSILHTKMHNLRELRLFGREILHVTLFLKKGIGRLWIKFVFFCSFWRKTCHFENSFLIKTCLFFIALRPF